MRSLLCKRLQLLRRVIAPAIVLTSALVLVGCQARTGTAVSRPRDGGSVRAIWVTRWDYKSAADIARIMDNCRGAGFNTVLFQVRGNGTVFYRSKMEPWADELGGRDPGFDPLAVACREARRRGLSLHAWVNVMPGWRGDKPPRNPRQLYRARPEWFLRDESGRRQPLGWYNSLNPSYPDVRKYLVKLCREIVEHYPIDGLHLDYIRFPNEWHASYLPRRRVPDYPRDPRTLALFRRATGQTPQSAPRQWDAWRTEQVTRVVRDIRSMMRSARPGLNLSAAVGASPKEAKRRHFQDSRRWLAEGLLDAVYPMNYAGDMSNFAKRLSEWSALRLRVPVVMGVMFDKRDASIVIEQLNRIRRHSPHFAAFAYNSLFERGVRPAGEPRALARAASQRTSGLKPADRRAALRKRLIPYLRSLAALRV